MVAGWLNVLGGTGGNNGWLYTNTSSGASTMYMAANAVTQATSPTQMLALMNAQQNAAMYATAPIDSDDYGNDNLNITLRDGEKRKVHLPDGTVIYVEKDGSFRIDDAQAKVVYRANRVRSFNPFLNASDKLEEFIKFCGEAGVRQGEMLAIPIKHFIAWLVIEAAKADGETIPEQPIPALPDLSMPRCRVCKRFMSRWLKADRIEFCRPICLERKLNGNAHTG